MTNIRHAHLTSDTIESTRLFYARGATNLMVRSRIISYERGRAHYLVTITRRGVSSENLPYSLVNLGIQGRAWKVRVLTVRGNAVVFTRKSKVGGEKERGPFTGHVAIEEDKSVLRRTQNHETLKVEPDRIWFINFEGDFCELEVVSFRPSSSVRLPSSRSDEKEGHEYVPPPPDPGGEDGGDDGGDEEERDGEK